MDDKILLTIAARGGSKGVPDKNIRELGGLPLIAYTIRQAKQWGRAAHIVCSTDSERIAQVARQYGAEVPFTRPAELAGDRAGKIGALRHALREMEARSGQRFPIVVDLDVTAPLRKVADIEGAYQLFLAQRPKTLFSVVPARKNPYFNMVEQKPGGYYDLVKKPDAAVLRRQDAAPVYDMNASIYFYDRDYLLDENNRSALSDRSLVWVMDEALALDIDSEKDLQLLDHLLAKGVIEL